MQLHETVQQWVTRVLQRERPAEQQPEQLAENLVAIAEEHSVPVEDLIRWVETRRDHTPIGTADFAGFAAFYHTIKETRERQNREDS